jgi:hypothetical protein
VSFVHAPFWADFITTMVGFKFSVQTGESGHSKAQDRSRLLTDIVAKVENRTNPKNLAKVAFGLLCCCVAFQRHYEGP